MISLLIKLVIIFIGLLAYILCSIQATLSYTGQLDVLNI